MIRHIDAYLQDSRAGSGQRQFLVLEERGQRTRLFYVPMLQVFWVKTRDLRNSKELTLKGVSARIRKARAERRRRNKLGKTSGHTWAVNATREALVMLREALNEQMTTKEIADDKFDAEFSEETMAQQPLVGEEETGMDGDVTEKTPETGKENTMAKTATVKKTKVKAPKVKKAPKESTGVKRPRLDQTQVITLKTNENPGREGSHRGNVFSMLKNGMSVAEAVKAVEKKYPDSAAHAAGTIKHYAAAGTLKLS